MGLINVDKLIRWENLFLTQNHWIASSIYGLFKQTTKNLQQINVKKCPSSIRLLDLNSQPSDYESPPLTTGPGLPIIYLAYEGDNFEKMT